MYKFQVLAQNKHATRNKFYIKNGYIKAESEEEAIDNLGIVFNSFNYSIGNIIPIFKN